MIKTGFLGLPNSDSAFKGQTKTKAYGGSSPFAVKGLEDKICWKGVKEGNRKK